MSEPVAYLNGRWISFAEAGLSLADAGFVSGVTIVDNCRTYRHRLFRWPDHLARFRRDCTACSIPLEPSDQQITSIAEELTHRNASLLPPGGELQVVTFATPGPRGIYTGEANGPPTFGMVSYPLPFARYRPFFAEGATLVAVNNVSPTADAILPPTVKHRSRLAWHIADQRASAVSPQALAVATDGDVFLETSVANLLAVRDGVLITPPRDQVLDGISLRVVRELVEVIEEPIRLGSRISELILTGTAFGIAGVSAVHIGESRFPFTWPGPETQRLIAAWSDLVGLDIASQFV
jgi:branched-subunit amino acid aminotransferase/4-amino-4-deoxychorismate lyase